MWGVWSGQSFSYSIRCDISLYRFSCLDDAELTLLGTPWESYRGIANEIGLDIIR